MANVKLPNRIYGNWIWKQSLLNHPDSVLLLRKEFVCSTVGLETNLWISACCAYQLFINGRFIGFGPRAHQNIGTSYIDQHDVTFFLEAGVNVIAVQVYYNVDQLHSYKCSPGLWCQMATSREEVLASDSSWMVFEGYCFCGPRARISADQGMVQFFRAEQCPRNWTSPIFMPDSAWSHPDCMVPVGDFGSRLELHPLAPPSIGVEHPPFSPVARGRVMGVPNWTQVVFEGCTGDGVETYAAVTYLFCERAETLEVRLFSDDPYKLFCNNKLVSAAECRMGETTETIELHSGWNRLLLAQTPGRHAMGFVILFPDTPFGNEVRIYQDMFADAPAAWSVAGPLKLLLAEATPSLRFDRLNVKSCSATLAQLTDPSSLLSDCVFETEAEPDWGRQLETGDYILFKLDTLRYGFVRLVVDALPGDIVDITIGMRRTEKGFVSAGDGVRGTGTIICRGGKNTYLSYIPVDCCYVMVSVRHAKRHILITSLLFEELLRPERHECHFRCSDEELNHFWEIGRSTLRRSAAFVPLAEARSDYDCYLIDAYIDAVNMAAVFGDFDYMTARLRQFVDAQLENGDIPALTFGTRHASQIHHLFFFPVWINYNYRYTANLVELERTIPALDMAREYFEAMLDDETGLLVDVESRFGLQSRLSHGNFSAGDIPTYLNAMFCRFLLSSAEIYRVVEQPVQASRCIKLAQRVATKLREYNFDPEAELFCRRRFSSNPEENEHNLFANFCAMFGGVLPLESFEHFFFSFFNFDPPFDRSDESRHPYFHFLFMEMMFALGQRDWAFRYFRDYWGSRICEEAGAWQADDETGDPAPTKFSDGSCVSPNIFLLREIVGIRIAEAGHSVIYFNPALNQVDWAEATVPMARGRLKVKWEKLADGSLDVTLDANIPVKIVPEMPHRLIRNTTFRLGERVTLLNPPEELVDDEEDEEAFVDEAGGEPEES